MVRVLSVKPLAAIGMVSYGLYLYHFPVFQAVQHQPRRRTRPAHKLVVLDAVE